MNRLRTISYVFVLLLLLSACSGAASPASAPTGAPTAASVGNQSGEGRQNDDGHEPDAAPVLPGQQLIVYTGTMDLEVTDLPAAVANAEQLVRGLGGHVASSHATDSEHSKSASVTYRIPAERWSEALNGLRGLGRVEAESTESEDVTAQVVDLDARIANLQATEGALQAIMDRATTISDVLKVQAELTSVRSNIESLTAQRALLSSRAALATLTVGFNIPVIETARATQGWDLGREVDAALAALVRLGQWAASMAIWIGIVVVPVLAPIALIAYLAYRARRRWLATHPHSV